MSSWRTAASDTATRRDRNTPDGPLGPHDSGDSGFPTGTSGHTG
jgi:hypothetical protein